MNAQTVCIPLNADGTIHDRLGQANSVAICKVDGDSVSDWTEIVVDWDTTYGVDVLGVHHPRVIRFLQEHQVNAVVADNVCDIMKSTLPTLGVTVHAGVKGNARSAVAEAINFA
jgi:predicted Fe-Mo cluster-binding NifX family protein